VKKTLYYADELNDDFEEAGRSHPPRVIDNNYVYDRKNPLWRALSFFLYYFVAAPLMFLFAKVVFGLKIKGRENLRDLRTSGFYIYVNHTHWLDAALPAIVAWPRRTFVVCGPRAMDPPLLPGVVPMLGGVPLNITPAGKIRFRAFLEKQIRRGRVVAIMPEAHVWPYYNKIRKFSERSFTYPVRQNAPVVGCVVTYRRRKLFPNLRPLMTITIDQPIYPSEWANAPDPKMFLRNRTLNFMRRTARAEQSYAHVKYLKYRRRS